MRSNGVRSLGPKTHEGGPAGRIDTFEQLERQVATCMLFEDTFYESGSTIADSIRDSILQYMIESVDPEIRPLTRIGELAIRARVDYKLRHVPLYLVSCMDDYRKMSPGIVSLYLNAVIQRADELAEFLAIHARRLRTTPDKIKKRMSAQVKQGLAQAFTKFSAYQLAKYNRDKEVTLRDVLFLCHAKPKDAEQKETWTKLINGTLESPNTWEVALSAGKDKKETWIRLMSDGTLGDLAFLRNLRNMQEVGVGGDIIHASFRERDFEKILPHQFVAAFRYAPDFMRALDDAMARAMSSVDKLQGKTALLIDVSGSMNDPLSSRSKMSRLDAASGLAIYLSEVCSSQLSIYTFSNNIQKILPLRGLGLIQAISESQEHGGTELFGALRALSMYERETQRVIVVTDEQAYPGNWGMSTFGLPNVHDMQNAWAPFSYLINVAPYAPGVETDRTGWTRINGFSERIIDFIRYAEVDRVCSVCRCVHGREIVHETE